MLNRADRDAAADLLSSKIDLVLEAAWRDAGVAPGEVCSDHEFLRRVSLDLVGRIPTLAEIEQFERAPNRSEVIRQRLESDDFPRAWSDVMTVLLVGYNEDQGVKRDSLRAWLERSYRRRMPFDQIATKLIAATGAPAFDGPVNFLVAHPEEPAVSVSRVFLGIRLDCARCHDHPFDRWKKEDLENMSRFFFRARTP